MVINKNEGRRNLMKIATGNKYIVRYFSLIILFWLCFSIGESEWTHKISYAFHESFYIPVNIGLFLIPTITAIMIIHYLIKIVRKENVRQNMVRFCIVSSVFIIHIFFLRYMFNFATTMGYAVIDRKTIEEEVCYIYVDNGENSTKLRCPSDIYSKLIVNEELAYRITYKWNKFTPEKGKLMEIVPEDTIDNRQ